MGSPKLAAPPAPRLVWPGSTCPASVTDYNRIIGTSQIYDLKQVKELIQLHGFVVLNDDTNLAIAGKGRNPLPPPAWSSEEVVGAIMSLTDIDYRNSQWCELNSKRYLDCDAYIIYFSRSKKVRSSGVQGIKLYIKFGFVPNVTSPKTIICRFHPADY